MRRTIHIDIVIDKAKHTSSLILHYIVLSLTHTHTHSSQSQTHTEKTWIHRQTHKHTYTVVNLQSRIVYHTAYKHFCRTESVWVLRG